MHDAIPPRCLSISVCKIVTQNPNQMPVQTTSDRNQNDKTSVIKLKICSRHWQILKAKQKSLNYLQILRLAYLGNTSEGPWQ